MKLKFKNQQFQALAVDSVVDCFKGQPNGAGLRYRIDPGSEAQTRTEMTAIGFKNEGLLIPESVLLENIQEVQRRQNLPVSAEIVKSKISTVNLDVEMETGTGKTYVYTRTIFEMNRRYGWNKYIIVVPSIAIREGVYKSLGKPDKRTGAQPVCNKVIGPQLGSSRCHGRWMEYEEYELLHKKSGLLIHVDAMIQLWGMRILGDFKTSKSAWAKDYVTPTNYYHQLNAYWWILKEQGITFNLASLIYVPRDFYCCNPRRWILKPIVPDYDKWKANVINKRKAEKCILIKDWGAFKKICKGNLCDLEDEHFGRCMFQSICHPGASIGRKSHYKEIWEPFVEKKLTWKS